MLSVFSFYFLIGKQIVKKNQIKLSMNYVLTADLLLNKTVSHFKYQTY